MEPTVKTDYTSKENYSNTLHELGACDDAIIDARRRSLEECWNTCNVPGWLIWLIKRTHNVNASVGFFVDVVEQLFKLEDNNITEIYDRLGRETFRQGPRDYKAVLKQLEVIQDYKQFLRQGNRVDYKGQLLSLAETLAYVFYRDDQGYLSTGYGDIAYAYSDYSKLEFKEASKQILVVFRDIMPAAKIIEAVQKTMEDKHAVTVRDS